MSRRAPLMLVDRVAYDADGVDGRDARATLFRGDRTRHRRLDVGAASQTVTHRRHRRRDRRRQLRLPPREGGRAGRRALEKGELTSGSTHHAAGLVTQFNPSPTMMRFRRYSVELYKELGVFETVGSLRIASSPESLHELRRGVSRAHGIGLDARARRRRTRCARLMPAASPGRRCTAPSGCRATATSTRTSRRTRVAAAARELGVEIRTQTRVTGIELGPRSRGARRPHRGTARSRRRRRQRGRHVGAAGRRDGRRVRAARSPSTTSTSPCTRSPGHELPRDMPCFRDTDNLVYGKAESGGVLFGGYEANPVVALGGRRAVGARRAHAARRTTSASRS